MGSIYRSSKECLLWLGEVEDEKIYPFERLSHPDPLELAILKETIQKFKLESPKPLQSIVTGTNSIDVPAALEVVDLFAQDKHLYELPFYRILPSGEIELCEDWGKAVYSLNNILQRSWWKRIWTAQEAFLPPQATVRIGSHSAPFDTFLKAATSWHRHVWSNSTLCCTSIKGLQMGHINDDLIFGVLADLAALFEARSNPGKSVAHNIFMLSINWSTLLRHDRVYGILGLVEEFFQIEEIPDYNVDLVQLYASTTIKFMKDAGHLCLIPYARPHHWESYMHQLPSWTPNWSTHAWQDYFDIYNHGGFTSDNMLTYEGACLGHTILKRGRVAVDIVSSVGRRITDMKTHPREFRSHHPRVVGAG